MIVPTRFSLHTKGNLAYPIQDEINEAVAASGVAEGIAVVAAPHTTAGLGIISYHDPLGLEDFMDEMDRLVPSRINFKHEHDTPQDAAGHVKSTIIGPTISLIVSEGAVLLGHSQKVFFFEFDGPRRRTFTVQVLGSPAAHAGD